MNDELSNEVCCPRFDPAPWDEKECVWKNRPFVKKNVFTLFYMPLNMSSVVTKTVKQMEKSKTMPERNKWLMLAYSPSMWKTELFFSVTKQIEGLQNENISGKFLTKVFEGQFKDCGKWHKEMSEYTKRKTGRDPKKIYFYYTTCPKCAKKYGKNYVVLFAHIL